MIKNVCTYFFLTASLLFFTPQAPANVEEEPIITETMIIEDEDSDTVFFDHMDYLADHLPTTVEHRSAMLQWIKNKLAPFYIALLIHLGKTHKYVANKLQILKSSLNS